jgi:hypothetical protein
MKTESLPSSQLVTTCRTTQGDHHDCISYLRKKSMHLLRKYIQNFPIFQMLVAKLIQFLYCPKMRIGLESLFWDLVA